MTNWYPIADDMLARDLWVTVPLNWDDPTETTIEVYAREVVDTRKKNVNELPVLLYLQGGPGGKSPRPLTKDPFFTAALARFRLVLLDQRGTGRSRPVQASDMTEMEAAEAAEFLAKFRADSIIRDAEAIREAHFPNERWWTIGQSYGGFLTLHYLSAFPDALEACVITGGLPSIDPDPEAVYKRTFPRVRAKNEKFFHRFPHLRSRVDRIADILSASPVQLADGDRLTVRRFQTLGLDLGMGSGYDRMHWLLDEAFVDSDETVLSDTFISGVGEATSFRSNPLFMVLQESIYGPGPTGWAAQRERKRHPDFDESARPLLFTGEMAFPWMVEEIHALRPFEEGAKALAAGRWPIDLYDHERLAANTTAIEAIVYHDDMYADASLSLDTASRVGEIVIWLTNEFEHDGIRWDGVVEKLFSRLERRLTHKNLRSN